MTNKKESRGMCVGKVTKGLFGNMNLKEVRYDGAVKIYVSLR
jgi:hypothetical protein